FGREFATARPFSAAHPLVTALPWAAAAQPRVCVAAGATSVVPGISATEVVRGRWRRSALAAVQWSCSLPVALLYLRAVRLPARLPGSSAPEARRQGSLPHTSVAHRHRVPSRHVAGW